MPGGGGVLGGGAAAVTAWRACMATLHVMRTTVELSDPLYRRVRALAAARGMRGFSSIVEEAVHEYLERGSSEPDGEAFTAARGAWGVADAAAFEAELRDAWATWPSSRS
jgi:predicted transcriptional regulator